MQAQSISVAHVAVKPQWLAGLGAFVIGAALLAVVGFAPISAVHNAAHDTRHSAAFPCH